VTARLPTATYGGGERRAQSFRHPDGVLFIGVRQHGELSRPILPNESVGRKAVQLPIGRTR
jgi:hypothetical protein